MPIGTAKKVKEAINAKPYKRGVDIPFDVASNPESYKKGATILVVISPDKGDVGVESAKMKYLGFEYHCIGK